MDEHVLLCEQLFAGQVPFKHLHTFSSTTSCMKRFGPTRNVYLASNSNRRFGTTLFRGLQGHLRG